MNSATITVDGDDSWSLRQAEVVEAVSAPGYVRIEALRKGPAPDPKSLLYKTVELKIPTMETSNPWRKVKGIVWEARSLGPFRPGDPRSVIKLVVVPPMMVMSLRRIDRSFGSLPAMRVWEEVVDAWGERVPFATEGPMMVLENEPCTLPLQTTHQAMETDLEFLLRLWNIHGVFWFNDSDGEDALPTLRLGTYSPGAAPWGSGTTLTYNPQVTTARLDANVLQFTRLAMAGPRTPVVISMHPALRPSVPPANVDVVGHPPSAASFRGYDWFEEESLAPLHGSNLGEMQTRAAGVLEQTMLLDEHWAIGTASTTTVTAGRRLDISGLPGDPGDSWFITANRTLIAGPGVVGGVDPEEPQILTSFRAVPLQVRFRPPLLSSRLDPPPLQGGLHGHDFDQVLSLGKGDADVSQ